MLLYETSLPKGRYLRGEEPTTNPLNTKLPKIQRESFRAHVLNVRSANPRGGRTRASIQAASLMTGAVEQVERGNPKKINAGTKRVFISVYPTDPVAGSPWKGIVRAMAGPEIIPHLECGFQAPVNGNQCSRNDDQ